MQEGWKFRPSPCAGFCFSRRLNGSRPPFSRKSASSDLRCLHRGHDAFVRRAHLRCACHVSRRAHLRHVFMRHAPARRTHGGTGSPCASFAQFPIHQTQKTRPADCAGRQQNAGAETARGKKGGGDRTHRSQFRSVTNPMNQNKKEKLKWLKNN